MMDENTRRDLIGIFSCVAGKDLKTSDFILSTKALVKHIQFIDQHKDRLDKPSSVNAELDQLIRDLEKLSNTARVHLHRVSKDVRETGIDPVTYLMLSATIKYYRPRTDKAVRLAIPIQAEKVLTSYGITCNGAKNGNFVKYLGIIGKLLDWDYDAYTLARDFYNPA